MVLDNLSDYARKFEELLRLKTFPLAVKMLEKDTGELEKVSRPLKDLGHHLSLCQGLAMARKGGETLAMMKEDMWCFEPVIGLGLAEAPEYFLQGNNRYPETARDMKAGENWARGMPRLEYGKYKGILFAPLASADFEPDIVILYVDSHQLTALLIAVDWMYGTGVTSKMSGHAACISSIVPVIKNGGFQVTSPCYGDISMAMAESNEVIFTAAIGEVEDLLEGLKVLRENENGLPIQHVMVPEVPMIESYIKIGKLLGMDWLTTEDESR